MEKMMETQNKLQIGQKAPIFSLIDINGKPLALEDFRDKIVILYFWSAECTWAKRTDEVLQQLQPAWGEPVVLLRVASNVNEDHELVQATAYERQLPYLLFDEQAQLADVYGAQTTPHLFVIDRQGNLRYQGAFDDITFRQRTSTQDYLRLAVEAVLAGKDPDPSETAAYGCAIVRPA